MGKTVIVLDFETAWRSTDYSLSKKNGMGMEEYIRHPLFHPLLLAVKINNGPIVVFEDTQIEAVLRQLPLNDPDVLVVAQNAGFDVSIIEMHYKIPVANPICTRSLARLTGVARLTGESLAAQNTFHDYGQKKAGTVVSDGKFRKEDFTLEEWEFFKTYNSEDVDQTYHHFTVMMEALFKSLSAEQIRHLLAFDSLTTRMYSRPTLVLDTELLAGYEIELVDKQEQGMQNLQRLFSFPDRDSFIAAIRAKGRTSPKAKGLPTFQVMLEMLGVKAPTKISDKRVASVNASKLWLTEMLRAYQAYGRRPLSKVEEKLYKKHRKNIETGVMIPALAKTDIEFMDMQDHENPDVALLCQTRAELNSSIELSRCRSFLGIARRGTLPVSLSAYQAITGRYAADNSASDIKSDSTNLQNLSSRSKNHTLKNSIRAPEGCVLVGADSSQIEARVNAWVWGQDDLVQAFAEGRDVYCEFGSNLYGRIITKADKLERQVSKTAVLQLGYQSGAAKLAGKLQQERVDVSTESMTHEEECKRIVKFYRNNYFHIKNGWKICIDVIKAMVRGQSGSFGGPNDNLFVYNGGDDIFGRPAASIMLPDGFKIWYPNLRFVAMGDKVSDKITADDDGYWYDIYSRKTKNMIPSRIYGGKMTNNIIQGLAFGIIRWQMLQIDKLWPVVLNVHDSIISIVPEDDAQLALDKMLNIMRTSPPWLPGGLPLNAEGNYGYVYE